MATSPTPFPAAFGTYSDPSASTTANSGGAGKAGDPRKKKLIDQIMASRAQAGQQRQMFQQGGPGYLDYVDQLRMNPFNTFY
jgi:hypothetical protein